ncbi:FecR family protein [Mucilaginibacter corticis]|uniref:FecR family protein n=1 Tax=Mucilaginibacter corticis TaxID=2597670 RepID=UPI001642A456|nr:FecR family protein [Mucilaginibacter corticis]
MQKLKDGSASQEDKDFIESWYLQYVKDAPSNHLSAEEIAEDAVEIWSVLQPTVAARKIMPLWTRIAAAGSIIIFFSIGIYFILRNRYATNDNVSKINQSHDIAPGRNQATLTLANGQTILLTKNMSGQIAKQGKTTVQAANGQLIYQASDAEQIIAYNTISTAKGEQSPYPITLADGTRIWLNAESKISFPTAFNQKERVVKLTGEAYFEVKHNVNHPFKVETAGQIIEDIGTSFNVNAYPDEKVIKTTLAEGIVKVNNLTLKPGQQTDGLSVKNVNVAPYTAWRTGDFDFQDENIESIMRQLARWYNIEVEYSGRIPEDGYTATISRKRNISAILRALERAQSIHFRIEGRRVIVSK